MISCGKARLPRLRSRVVWRACLVCAFVRRFETKQSRLKERRRRNEMQTEVVERGEGRHQHQKDNAVHARADAQ